MQENCPASLYDGQSALRRDGRLIGDGMVLLFVDDNGCEERIESAALFHLDERGGRLVYADRDRDGWRLLVDNPPPHNIAALLPKISRYGWFFDHMGLKWTVPVLAGISATILFGVYMAPQWLAPLVPMSVERKLGEAVAADFSDDSCKDAAGRDALDTLTRRIEPNADDLEVEVVDFGIVNAAALPGGKILLFRGLIDEAESPDEVAGVLAHEIGHVRERHVMEALLRDLGVGFLLSGSGMAGDTASTLLSLNYSRDAEREADQWSIAAMKDAQISPADTAEFFARLSKGEGDWTGYLSTHPQSRERRDRFANSARKGEYYKPSLNEWQWKALQQICEE